jgi:outer membrane protein OmpA-like peptidoglycan-associated protein
VKDEEFDQLLRERHQAFVTHIGQSLRPSAVPRRSHIRRASIAVAVAARMSRLLPARELTGVLASVLALCLAIVVALSADSDVPPAATTASPPVTVKVPAASAIPAPSMQFLLEFQPNSAKLTPASHRVLHQVSSTLREASQGKITITGRTASIGNAGSARKLSLDRAEAVRDLLVSSGVRADLLAVQGLGYHHPLVADRDAQGRLIPEAAQRNRSVVITVEL